MKRTLLAATLLTFAVSLALGQDSPSFEAADVHESPKSANPSVYVVPGRGSRFEIREASLVDLIRMAYGFEADRVFGGPTWLEMKRFDIAAKLPPGTTSTVYKSMIPALLETRFGLRFHQEMRPLPAYVLTAGKKLQLREADGEGATGCKAPAESIAKAENVRRVASAFTITSPQAAALLNGVEVQYDCRNMTMAAFAEALKRLAGVNLGVNPVVDQTALDGRWNFELKYTVSFTPGAKPSILESVEKQLGLKLEEKPVPNPVLVVDSVSAAPTANDPNIAAILPPVAYPTEFEVASIKPSAPGARTLGYSVNRSGQFTAQGMVTNGLVTRAFRMRYEQIIGLPKWQDTDHYDIFAKIAIPPDGTATSDLEVLAPMLRALLVDRFKMTYHSEERMLPAYSLVAAKPHMKKADPASRAYCRVPPGASLPPGTRQLGCQHVTMAQLADQLQNMSTELWAPVLDATGLDGAWDFTLTYSIAPPTANATAATASDPSGGYTLFEAIEKQLGLKLEVQMRSLPVVVIDRLEKPTEN